MIRKKQVLAAALSATMLFGTVAVFADDDDTMTSYLTGEPVSEEQGLRRPIAFTIDNVTAAIPQSGISEADMYYECEVETDLSRITAVFEQYDGIEKIGPLRSCRDYFISLVSGLDPIYQHYGQAAYALPYLESGNRMTWTISAAYWTMVWKDSTVQALTRHRTMRTRAATAWTL